MEAHFPAGTWYSAWDEAGGEAPILSEPAGRREALAAPLGHVPVHLRGGAVLPLQAGGPTTAAARASGLTLVVALPEQARRWHTHSGSPHSQDSLSRGRGTSAACAGPD